MQAHQHEFWLAWRLGVTWRWMLKSGSSLPRLGHRIRRRQVPRTPRPVSRIPGTIALAWPARRNLTTA